MHPSPSHIKPGQSSLFSLTTRFYSPALPAAVLLPGRTSVLINHSFSLTCTPNSCPSDRTTLFGLINHSPTCFYSPALPTAVLLPGRTSVLIHHLSLLTCASNSYPSSRTILSVIINHSFLLTCTPNSCPSARTILSVLIHHLFLLTCTPNSCPSPWALCASMRATSPPPKAASPHPHLLSTRLLA